MILQDIVCLHDGGAGALDEQAIEEVNLASEEGKYCIDHELDSMGGVDNLEVETAEAVMILEVNAGYGFGGRRSTAVVVLFCDGGGDFGLSLIIG